MLLTVACGTSPPPPCAGGTECPGALDGGGQVVDIDHGATSATGVMSDAPEQERRRASACADLTALVQSERNARLNATGALQPAATARAAAARLEATAVGAEGLPISDGALSRARADYVRLARQYGQTHARLGDAIAANDSRRAVGLIEWSLTVALDFEQARATILRLCRVDDQGTTSADPAVPIAKGPFPVSSHPDLADPTKATRTAPRSFRVRFETTQGSVDLYCLRSWAPQGADRLFNLVTIGFYDDVAFFRAISGFMTQFGIHGVPTVAKAWKDAHIPADQVMESNLRGRLSFAQAGRAASPGYTADDRTTQLFINLKDNLQLDGMGFAPVCEVANGMDVLEALHSGYGSRAGGDQANIQNQGNAYLRTTYPALDYIIQARIIFAMP